MIFVGNIKFKFVKYYVYIYWDVKLVIFKYIVFGYIIEK